MQAILLQQKNPAAVNIGKFPGSTDVLKPVLIQLTNSIEKLIKVTVGQAKVSPNNVNPSASQSLNTSLETEIENAKFRDKQVELLQKIEENTRDNKSKVEKAPDEKGIPSMNSLALSGAVIGGAIVGMVQGYLKAIKTIFGTIFETIAKGFKSLFKETWIAEQFNNIKNTVTDIFKSLQEGFKTAFSEEGPIGGIVKKVKSFFSEEGLIGKGFSNIMNFFEKIGTYMRSFSGVFKFVSKIFSRIFYPLTIIMTAWDMIQESIKGWEEGGLAGMLGGALKGLSHIVTDLADLIKDSISWILGKLGFEQAAEWLDSFSFKDIVDSMIDKLMWLPKKIQEYILAPSKLIDDSKALINKYWDPITNIVKDLTDALLFIPKKIYGLLDEYILTPLADSFEPVVNFFKDLKNQVMGFFENFGIPAVGFTMPVTGKEYKIGPWYPFKKEESNKKGIEAKSKNVAREASEEKNAKTTSVEYDEKTKTGNVITKDAKGNIVSKKDINEDTYNSIKKETEKNNGKIDESKIADIIKEQKAYEQLGMLDRMKVSMGSSSASELLAAKDQDKASQIYEKSADNATAKVPSTQPGNQNNVVNAPVTTNNSQKIFQAPPPIRNQDPSTRNYVWSKQAYGGL